MPEVENKTIHSRKSMPTVLWNPHGFPVMTMLHSRVLFDAPWFVDQNLIPLVEKFCLLDRMSDKEIGSACRQCASSSFKDDSKLARTS
jgi:hypothetical protein